MVQNVDPIKNALQDVDLIKEMMEKSKVQLTVLSSLFLWYGLLSLLSHGIAVSVVSIFISHGFYHSIPWITIFHYLIFTLLAVSFFIKRRLVVSYQNTYTLHLVDLWGFILFFIPLLQYVFIGMSRQLSSYQLDSYLLQSVENDFSTIIYISVVMGFIITGILIHSIPIKVFAILMIIIYPILFLWLGEFNLTTKMTSVSYILLLRKNCAVYLRTLALIILGIYLRYGAGGVRNGNQ